jgi:NADH-quinone oxidoreductase subunit F
MGMAKRAVEAIDFDLMQEKRYHLLYKTFDYRNVVPEDLKKSPKNVSYKLDVRDRVGSFVEVDCGYTGQQALNEVSRCLRCDVRCDE